MTLQFLFIFTSLAALPIPMWHCRHGPGQPSVTQLICRRAGLDLPPLRCLSQLFLAQHWGVSGSSFPEAVGAACLAHEQLALRGCSCGFGM